MTFRELTELQEKSHNAAHRSAIMHSGNVWLEPTGSRSEMDCCKIWIATGSGWRTGDGSAEVDNRRWMTGEKSRKMDQAR
jgi:hypothetical protein